MLRFRFPMTLDAQVYDVDGRRAFERREPLGLWTAIASALVLPLPIIWMFAVRNAKKEGVVFDGEGVRTGELRIPWPEVESIAMERVLVRDEEGSFEALVIRSREHSIALTCARPRLLPALTRFLNAQEWQGTHDDVPSSLRSTLASHRLMAS